MNIDTVAVNYILDNLETFKNESKELTAYKDLLFEGNGGVVLGPMPGLPTLPPLPAAVPAGVFKRIAFGEGRSEVNSKRCFTFSKCETSI